MFIIKGHNRKTNPILYSELISININEKIF